MEKCKRKILEDREPTWRLKSRALWLESGDENTQFFQAYARGRKTSNTIWSLHDQSQREVTCFEGMAQLGRSHFQSLFKCDPRISIVEVIRLALFFPSFVDKENNKDLMAEVTEVELKEIIFSIQKEKIPGLDGWTIEFF